MPSRESLDSALLPPPQPHCRSGIRYRAARVPALLATMASTSAGTISKPTLSRSISGNTQSTTVHTHRSNCLECQATRVGREGVGCLTMALRKVKSLRIHAMKPQATAQPPLLGLCHPGYPAGGPTPLGEVTGALPLPGLRGGDRAWRADVGPLRRR